MSARGLPERDTNIRAYPERDTNIRAYPEHDTNIRANPEHDTSARESPARDTNVRIRPERRTSGQNYVFVGMVKLLLLAAALVSGEGCGRSDTPSLGPASMQVVPGVYMLRSVGPSAAYVVETDSGLVLIDAGLESDAHTVKAEMATLNLDWREIRGIFLTHAHADHTGGAQHLKEGTRAVVYAGRQDAAVLQRASPPERIATAFMPSYAPHPTEIDASLIGGEVFDFGGTKIRAIAAPGHSPGSMCYLVERGGTRIFFGGDVIMRLAAGEEPRYDLPGRRIGTYTAYFAPRYGGQAESFLASLHALRRLPVPDIVLPGHPDAPPEQNPRMDAERWQSMLDQAIAELDTLIARRRRDGADFLDGSPRMLIPDLMYLGDLQGAALYGFISDATLFLMDAPGGADLLSMVRASMERLGRVLVEPAFVLLTSADSASTAGLRDVVRETGAIVVVGRGGIEEVRRVIGPGATILDAREAYASGRIPVEVLQLDGRGTAPVAYILRRGGKTALFSGRIPIRISDHTVADLLHDVLREPGGAEGYLAALDRLEPLDPDLWLPLYPQNGQDANLYGNRWELIIQDNREGLRRALGLAVRRQSAESILAR